MLATFMAGPLKFLFDNMPAIDILRGTNQVDKTNEDLDLCFAGKVFVLDLRIGKNVDTDIACGDIRNVVETILGIPATFEHRVRVLLNDFDEVVASRCVMLLILALSDEQAAEKMLHLWYSAFLPKDLLSRVVSDFNKAPEKKYVHVELKKFLKMQWRTNEKAQSITTSSKVIEELENHLDTTRELSKCDLARKSRVLSQDVFDNMESSMFAMDAFRRVSYMKFMNTGLVLPIAAVTDSFTEPNPSVSLPSGW